MAGIEIIEQVPVGSATLDLPKIDSLEALTLPIAEPPQSEGPNRELRIGVSSSLLRNEPEIHQALEEILNKHGGSLFVVAASSFWIEDAAIPLGNSQNQYLVSNFNRDNGFEMALKAVRSLDLPGLDAGQGKTVRIGYDGTTESMKSAQYLLAQGFEVEQSKFLLEGGNILHLGEKTLIGRSTLLINMEYHDQRGSFDPEQVKSRAAAGTWSEERMQEARAIADHHLSDDVSAEALDSYAREILAKIDMTREMIAEELNVPPSTLIDVSQDVFHIDMMMRPIGDNRVMLDDPVQMNQLLQETLNDPTLTDQQRTDIALSILPPDRLAERVAVLDRVAEQLAAAGIEVVRVPGTCQPHQENDPDAYLYPGLGVTANIMNGIIGTVPNGDIVYITNGTGIEPLDDRLRTILLNQGIDHVEFIEHRLLESEGGLDCVTIGEALPPPMPGSVSSVA